MEFFFKFNKWEGSRNGGGDGFFFSFVKVKKQGGWKFSSKLINGQAQITAGRMEFFSFVQVKKQGGWKFS